MPGQRVSAVAMGLTWLLGSGPGLTRAAGFCRSRQSRHVSKGGAGANSPPLPVSTWPLFPAEPGRRISRASSVATRAGDGGGVGQNGGLAGLGAYQIRFSALKAIRGNQGAEGAGGK